MPSKYSSEVKSSAIIKYFVQNPDNGGMPAIEKRHRTTTKDVVFSLRNLCKSETNVKLSPSFLPESIENNTPNETK